MKTIINISETEMICRLIEKFGFEHPNTLQFKEMLEYGYNHKSLERAYLLYIADES